MSRKRNQVMEAAATGTAVSNGKQQPAAASSSSYRSQSKKKGRNKFGANEVMSFTPAEHLFFLFFAWKPLTTPERASDN